MAYPEKLYRMMAQRTPQAYRRGYYDGYYGKPHQAEIAGDDHRDTFPRKDYSAGYAVGANDAHWNTKRNGRMA